MAYFAVAPDANLANLVNVETLTRAAPHILPDKMMPLTGVVRRRSLSGKMRHDGALNGELIFDMMSRTALNTFVNTVFGDWETASMYVALTLLTENGYYSAFKGYIEKPTFTLAPGGYAREISCALSNLQLQTVTKTASATLTAAERLVYGDTTTGSVTLTLPAASAVAANTVVSIEKRAAANNLVIDGNGAETIDGAATQTLTALYDRLDLYSTGSVWKSI